MKGNVKHIFDLSSELVCKEVLHFIDGSLSCILEAHFLLANVILGLHFKEGNQEVEIQMQILKLGGARPIRFVVESRLDPLQCKAKRAEQGL